MTASPVGGGEDRQRAQTPGLDGDPDAQRTQATRAVREASDDWAEAMRAHKLAPPDPGFAARLSRLAEAAKREQAAWEHAHAAGLLWRPIPGADRAEPPYELRPGTGRRGPAHLWERFDVAVTGLNRAIAGSSAAAVADAFGEMASAARTLADAVREDAPATQQDVAVPGQADRPSTAAHGRI